MAIMRISKILVLGSNPSAPAINIFYRATEKLQKGRIHKRSFLI